MLSSNTIKAIKSGVPQSVNELLIAMVKDLEDTRELYHGYSYVRTMRNILIGKEDAVIAPNFKKKPYYGRYKEMTLEVLELIMDVLVEANQLDVIYTEHGKLYCTHEYHEYLCKKNR